MRLRPSSSYVWRDQTWHYQTFRSFAFSHAHRASLAFPEVDNPDQAACELAVSKLPDFGTGKRLSLSIPVCWLRAAYFPFDDTLPTKLHWLDAMSQASDLVQKDPEDMVYAYHVSPQKDRLWVGAMPVGRLAPLFTKYGDQLRLEVDWGNESNLPPKSLCRYTEDRRIKLLHRRKHIGGGVVSLFTHGIGVAILLSHWHTPVVSQPSSWPSPSTMPLVSEQVWETLATLPEETRLDHIQIDHLMGELRLRGKSSESRIIQWQQSLINDPELAVVPTHIVVEGDDYGIYFALR